ncbi:efflux RND transporter periplasmic adaptor subunit [Pontibacter chitinilyticus]|uniref:efflux RND transporter periplasmic adaptor subunit n=1 Tax=Pontibacter chitinilyticus TaxID=2674989 RepID=UPI00321A9BCD
MKYQLFILAAALTLAGCSTKQATEATTEAKPQESNLVQLTKAQLQNAKIKTSSPELRSISSTLLVNGAMEAPPQNMVSVSVPLGGYLKQTELLPGMHVKKGQLLAVLEDQSYVQLQQDYLTAKAHLAYLQQEYERQRDLNQSKASSDKVYQQTEAEYKSQQVLLQALAEKLRLIGINSNRLSAGNLSRTLRVTSPINGYVTKVNVNIGKYVVPTDVLFELVDPSDLHLMLTVFEKDLDKVEIGQKVLAYRANHPEKKYPAEIVYIGKDVGNDRAVEVHCHLHQEAYDLLPGMFMNAAIDVQQQQAYTLPTDAIVRFESKEYVFADRGNGVYEMLETKTGESENGYTILQPTASLKPEQQQYVTNGAYALLMKLKNKSDEE